MPPCGRLWCSTPQGEDLGCRTQHMPWADGTVCGKDMWCMRSQCVSMDNMKNITVDGGWGQWKSWSSCSRTCGGGVRKTTRECDNPEPTNGGLYCVGERVRYEACNIKPCNSSHTYRHEQCQAYNGNNFNIEGLPPDVKWVPKYTGISEGDACKLYCRVDYSSNYYLLASTVVDGTPCTADSFDKCVAGTCVAAGCDHQLDSTVKLDICGVCGGDNSTCVRETGRFNKSEYGYNYVTRIPGGAANLEIRQVGYLNKRKDDTYIALRDTETGEYIINGGFVVSMFTKSVQYGGSMLEYSGSDVVEERIFSSKTLNKDLVVEVLSVGNVYPPQVTYSYLVSKTKPPTYRWKITDKWSHCDSLCKGRQSRESVCVEDTPQKEGKEVTEEYCTFLPKPEHKTKVCNSHCSLEWDRVQTGNCSASCGPGVRSVSFVCIKVTPDLKKVSVLDKYCEKEVGSPGTVESCEGPCQGLKWRYGAWSSCSKTCGGGSQQRMAVCEDGSSGVTLADTNCQALEKVTSQSCGESECPSWETGDWSVCNVTCGRGVRQRPYWCQLNHAIQHRELCDQSTTPRHREPCDVRPCAAWSMGEWTACSANCGQGTRRRTVRCLSVENKHELDPELCNDQEKPANLSTCEDISCQETRVQISQDISLEDISEEFTNDIEQTRRKSVLPSPESSPQNKLSFNRNRKLPFRWKFGQWRECSEPCGGGEQTRPVACYDRINGVQEKNEEKCSRFRRRPIDKQPCNHKKCPTGDWLTGAWSGCSVTCGKGIRRRKVSCVSREDGVLQGETICLERKPGMEEICDLSPCHHSVPQIALSLDIVKSATMVGPGEEKINRTEEERMDKPGSFHWRTGDWQLCSASCGRGIRQRDVSCIQFNDIEVSVGQCNQERKPQEREECNSEPCPQWNFGDWSQCSVKCGGGVSLRLVRCQDHLGQNLPDHQCELENRPNDRRSCQLQSCTWKQRRSHAWKVGKWSQCSKTCERGERRREVVCFDLSSQTEVTDKHCLSRPKPKYKKACNKIPCPFKWIAGDWSQCSHTCGRGVQTRRVSCHRVNTFSWVDPDETPHGCNSSSRPDDLRSCMVVPCSSMIRWETGDWGECTWSKCGKSGKKRRKVFCQTNEGERIRNKMCKKNLSLQFKPKKTQRCPKNQCGYQSCLDVKQKLMTTVDGEYLILLGGKNISIYCHKMSTSMPKEYLSLPSGEKENYSEVYGRRLIIPNSCPNNGSRFNDCDCVKDESREGLTMWSKISINVTSLSINSHDFTFSRQVQGEHVPYGEAGDCYSAANCPQGKFSINLSGTGLRVSPFTGWVGVGNRPSIWLQRVQDNQMIYGKCGGYCGTCVPEHHIGLKLDLLPT